MFNHTGAQRGYMARLHSVVCEPKQDVQSVECSRGRGCSGLLPSAECREGWPQHCVLCLWRAALSQLSLLVAQAWL